mmetsp:Transcript_88789/g.259530  ORF Transcript_88789/g.259530 Transcript_88789/m.259530 type:complete len:84 (-) Transcript_88789:5251-5502(-)
MLATHSTGTNIQLPASGEGNQREARVLADRRNLLSSEQEDARVGGQLVWTSTSAHPARHSWMNPNAAKAASELRRRSSMLLQP